MPAELDRLKAWMAKNGYTHESLSAKLYYGRTGFLKNVMNGKRPIGFALRHHFAYRFGREALFDAFGVTVDGDLDKQSAWEPEKYAARRAVSDAIRFGEMLPAQSHKCVGCDKQAVEYHHPSYHPEDKLNVVPVCRTCHQRHHKGGMALPPGIVPTAVGLVRIAIAPPIPTP